MASRKHAMLSEAGEGRGFLDGKFLIAMPNMSDRRFARTVIYICAHSSDGAMGLVINKRSEELALADLLTQLKIVDEQTIMLPETRHIHVLNGGPVEKSRGFVLHSTDFFLENSSLPIDEGIAMTITMDILKAIADGKGPEKAIVALGYAGWGPGQLEQEIQDNGWLHCGCEPSLIFDPNHDTKYERAMRLLGVDPAMLSGEVGRA